VVFEEGIRIEGNLLTGGGATIPHQNLIWKSMDRPDVRAMDLECSVDDSGRFELEGLAPGRYLVAIEKSGVTAEVQLSDDAYQDLEVVMDPPVILRLRVEDPDGLPVGDTRVTIHEFVNGRRLHHVRFLFTDARGRCTLAGVGLRGRLVMAAVNEAGQGRLEVNAADVDTELTIRLLSGATVTGRIVNSQGEPMADAVVVAMTPGEFKKEWRYNRIVADEEGRFAFESFPGRVRLRAKNAAHGVASLDFDVEPGEDHKLAPVVLGTSGAIRGVVVDSDGHPVQAVTVKIHAGTRELETMEEFDGGLRTDADGWFAAIAPDGVYTLKVRPDVEPGPATVSGVRPGDPPVRIRMDIE
jgi:protocatechuate 3,4-dioxygenase beta subunit